MGGILLFTPFQLGAATAPCAITLPIRRELQTTRHLIAVWKARSLPLWPEFQPTQLALHLPDSACLWLFQAEELPPGASILPDMEGIFALPAEPRVQAEAGEPSFCQPLAQAFENWLQLRLPGSPLRAEGWIAEGDWRPEYLALQKALAAASGAVSAEWIRVFLAARALRRAAHPAAFSDGQALAQERLKGLRAWLCLELESQALEGPPLLPPELEHSQPFRSMAQLQAELWQESPDFLSPELRRARLGLLQILLLARLKSDWKQALMRGRLPAELLAEQVQFGARDLRRLRTRVAALTLPWQNGSRVRQAQPDPRSFTVALDLPADKIELRPQALQVLSAGETLFLEGSEVRLSHPRLWGVIRGPCQIQSLTGGILRLRFPLSLQAQLRRVPGNTPDCESVQIQSARVMLRGECLQLFSEPLQVRIAPLAG